MNLQKLYTCNGPMYVDVTQLQGPRQLLTIYTARGNRVKDVGRSHEVRQRAMYGVHRDNLFASLELAEANRERIIADFRGGLSCNSPTAP